MTYKDVTVKRLICDGCVYPIGPRDDDHYMLTYKEKGKASVELHFHAPTPTGEVRSWGTDDCLQYWINKRRTKIENAAANSPSTK